MSSSACSNTVNANIVCLPEYAVGAIVARTARQPSSICSLSTNLFRDLSRVNVVAVDVFVPRSAQLSCDLTVLRVSVFALMTCCNHNVRTYNDLTFPTPHVYRSHALQICPCEVMLQLGNRRTSARPVPTAFLRPLHIQRRIQPSQSSSRSLIVLC